MPQVGKEDVSADAARDRLPDLTPADDHDDIRQD
jgi:hypothetical protein